MPDIQVQQELCTQCGACLELCTSHVFGQMDGQTQVVAPEECWLCGHCIAACPVDAIAHGDYPLEDCPGLEPAKLPSLDALTMVFRERRSQRVFRDKSVPRPVVRQLVDLSRWVPSANNDQPVDWLAIDDPEQIAALGTQVVETLASAARLLRNRLLRPLLLLAWGTERVKKGLEAADSFEHLAQRHAAGQDPIFRHAPLVLIAHVPGDDYFGRDNAVYAAYNLMLAAQRVGLGTCHIGYFTVALDRNRHLCEAFGLPKGRKAEVALILGYPTHHFHRLLPRRQPDLVWTPAPQ